MRRELRIGPAANSNSTFAKVARLTIVAVTALFGAVVGILLLASAIYYFGRLLP